MDELWIADEDYGREVRQKLWALLAGRVRDYTLGDSGSLPTEVAEELFRSLLYTLRLYLDARGETLQALTVRDGDQLFAEALCHLEGEIQRCKEEYLRLLAIVPAIPHRALTDTLRNIGIGLARYPYRHFAHQQPAEIDYQLCLPVPEELQGITYLREYLRRLTVESLFLGRFDPRQCMGLLSRRYPDYGELLINLYEPVMNRALGRALTGEPPELPGLPCADLTRLPQGLDKRALQAAAGKLCQTLKLPEECRAYVEESALALLPRLLAAAEHGALKNLF